MHGWIFFLSIAALFLGWRVWWLGTRRWAWSDRAAAAGMLMALTIGAILISIRF